MGLEFFIQINGSVFDQNDKIVADNVIYSIDVLDFLVEIYVDRDGKFDDFDDFEARWAEIAKDSVRETVSYLIFLNDTVVNLRSEIEEDIFRSIVRPQSKNENSVGTKSDLCSYRFLIKRAFLLETVIEFDRI